MTQQPYGDSTIAMSAVNLMTVTGGPLSIESILAQLVALQHPRLGMPQLVRALKALRQKGLAKPTLLGWVQTDQQRRLIVSRNLDDVRVEDDGSVTGGWTGWMRCERTGKLSGIISNNRRGANNETNSLLVSGSAAIAQLHARNNK